MDQQETQTAGVQHLNFEFVSTDGGEHAPCYARKVLDNNRSSVHSSVERKNVNLIFKYNGPSEQFTLTHVVVRAPGQGYSAPIKDGLIFVTNELLSSGVLQRFDDLNSEQYDKLVSEAKKEKEEAKDTDNEEENGKDKEKEKPEHEAESSELGKAEGEHEEDKKNEKADEDKVQEDDEDDDQLLPVAYFNLEGLSEGIFPCKLKKGSYLTVKLLSASGDQTSIDIEYLGFVGFDGATAPPKPLPEISRNQIAELGLVNKVPRFVVLGKDSLALFTEMLSAIPCSLVFVDRVKTKEEAQALIPAFQKAAESIDKNKDLIVFFCFGYYLDREPANEAEGEEAGLAQLVAQLRDLLGLHEGDGPLVAVLYKRLKYIMDSTLPLTEENVEAFYNAFFEDKLVPFFKSRPEPEESEKKRFRGVTLATGNTFESIILDEAKDVFVYLYTDQTLIADFLSKFMSVGRLLADTESIVISQMDLDNNDVHPKYIVQKDVPMVFFYGKGKKDKPVKYTGALEAEPVLRFLYELSEDKFDLESKISALPNTVRDVQRELEEFADTVKKDLFEKLKADPTIRMMQQAIKQRPELLSVIVKQVAESNEFLRKVIMTYQQDFINLLLDTESSGGPADSSHTDVGQSADELVVTASEGEALDELVKEGFDSEEILEAFLHCNRDVKATRQYLTSRKGSPSSSGSRGYFSSSSPSGSSSGRRTTSDTSDHHHHGKKGGAKSSDSSLPSWGWVLIGAVAVGAVVIGAAYFAVKNKPSPGGK